MMPAPFCVSRLPVGSSAKMIFGSLIRARQMATRCFSPPESWWGKLVARLPTPTRVSRLLGTYARIGRSFQLGREGHVLQRVQRWNQVKRLKDEAEDLIANRRQLVLGQVRDIQVIDANTPCGRLIEAGEDAQQRRFAAAAAAHDHDKLAWVDGKGHVVQHGNLHDRQSHRSW